MSGDAPDWQHVAQTVIAVSGDAPDWQYVIVGPNGVPIGSGGYASLTGPGETTTPGYLQQEGGLLLDAPVGDPVGINLSNESSNQITVADNGGGGIVIVEGGGTGGILIRDNGGGGTTIEDDGVGGIAFNANFMSFFTTPVAAQPTVTGSRGGNAALASLLTGLATLGLIIDSSTP